MTNNIKTATVWVHNSPETVETFATLADVTLNTEGEILKAIPFSWNYPESGEPFKRYYTALDLSEIADYVIED